MGRFFDFSIESSAEGFGMFSAAHVLCLGLCLALCLLACRAYRRADTGGRRKLRRAVAFSAAAVELLRALLLALAGRYTVGRLPLHLCGIAVYLCAFHACRPDGRLWQFLYAFCMPGAVFALLFPDWEYYPLLHFITLSSFFLHICIVTYVLLPAAGREERPSLRAAPRNLLYMAALALPVFIFDRLTGTNYMFLNWPVPPLTLFSGLGRPGYLLGYLPMIAVTWAVIYMPLGTRGKKRGRISSCGPKHG